MLRHHCEGLEHSSFQIWHSVSREAERTRVPAVPKFGADRQILEQFGVGFRMWLHGSMYRQQQQLSNSAASSHRDAETLPPPETSHSNEIEPSNRAEESNLDARKDRLAIAAQSEIPTVNAVRRRTSGVLWGGAILRSMTAGAQTG